jgi:putative phosphoesterase
VHQEAAPLRHCIVPTLLPFLLTARPLCYTPHAIQFTMKVGLVSDTHGVFDPELSRVFQGLKHILHAGDVGSHGGSAAVLAAISQGSAVTVTAVRGNVDDDPEAMELLPDTAVLHIAGWVLLIVHILESTEAAAAMEQHEPDIVISGHSHKWKVETVEATAGRRQLRINPGSAGPGRFKLGRSVALLTLPDRGEAGEVPADSCADLSAHCPKNLAQTAPPLQLLGNFLVQCRQRHLALCSAHGSGS